MPGWPLNRLAAIRLIHTVVWAFFVACIGAIPVLAWRREFGGALLCIGLVGVEVLVLAFNRWRCPLTPIAARYTAVQPDNFDIYLPLWLARYNKQLFGTLYLAGVFLTAALWLGWMG